MEKGVFVIVKLVKLAKCPELFGVQQEQLHFNIISFIIL